MPQEFLHLFDRLTLVNQKAACRMPQIMKANDWKVATLQDNTKPRTDVVRLIGFPVRPLADVTFLSKGHLKKAVVGLLLLFQRQQIGLETGGQKEITSACLTLGLFLLWYGTESNDGVADVHLIVVKIHVHPAQSRDLRTPQAEVQAQINSGLDGIAFYSDKQLTRFFCGVGMPAELLPARRGDHGAGIIGHFLHFDCFVEYTVENDQVLLNAGWRLTFCFLGIHIALNYTRRHVAHPQVLGLKIGLDVAFVIAVIRLIGVLPQTPLFAFQPFFNCYNQELMIGKTKVVCQLFDLKHYRESRTKSIQKSMLLDTEEGQEVLVDLFVETDDATYVFLCPHTMDARYTKEKIE